MNNNTVLTRRAGIMTADMNGSTVMMDIETGKYYNLGEIGGYIWELLESPMKITILIDKLTKEFNVSREQCEKDTIPFLNSLVERGLLLIIQA